MLTVAVVHSGGPYQERVCEYLRSHEGAQVTDFQLPVNLPLIVDDAADFVPMEVAEAEVVIAIALHPNLLAELPYVMGKGQGKALLVPQEEPTWVRPGLMGQVTRACSRFGIESASPKPFCALEPMTPVISQFCREYRAGHPELELECHGGLIATARCLRSSPCGLTAWAAGQLAGMPCDASLLQRLADLLHQRPCLASMAMDRELGDTIMHASMDILRSAGRKALSKVGVKVE